jgi:hypothetical protein
MTSQDDQSQNRKPRRSMLAACLAVSVVSALAVGKLESATARAAARAEADAPAAATAATAAAPEKKPAAPGPKGPVAPPKLARKKIATPPPKTASAQSWTSDDVLKIHGVPHELETPVLLDDAQAKALLALAGPAKTAAPTPTSIVPAARTDASPVIPDFKGKRLTAVRREARKLGMFVVAHDAGGDQVDPDMAAMYRVRRQLTAAGSPVRPGTAVEVDVREIDLEPASGY